MVAVAPGDFAVSISQVIALVNQMEAAGVIGRYAVGGAVGATFYLEPVATLDVDIFVAFRQEPGQRLLSPQPILDYLTARLLRVPLAPATREAFVAFLDKELGTDSLDRAKSYMEDALRMTAHLIMSTPEYQLV